MFAGITMLHFYNTVLGGAGMSRGWGGHVVTRNEDPSLWHDKRLPTATRHLLWQCHIVLG